MCIRDSGYSDDPEKHIALPYEMVCAADVDELNFLAARLEQLDPDVYKRQVCKLPRRAEPKMIRLDEKQYRAVKKMTRAACANNDCCLLYTS